MSYPRKNLSKVCSLVFLASLLVACGDKFQFDPSNNPGGDGNKKVANTFNFSTVQKVQLNVDYSAFKTYGPVFFGVYTQNPFIEGSDVDLWDENATPIFEDYTDANGKFSEIVELPTYAQHLYIATGNFFTGMYLMEADVKNSSASVVAENLNVVTSPVLNRAAGPGESTNDLSALNLTNIITADGTVTDEKLYNDWKNWLGSWNSATGYPDYLLDKSTADSKLVISEDEMEGLYATVGKAFVSGSAMNEEYCSYPDLLLEKESEVTFTLLGSSTCWNSSLGYYWYTDDNKPTKPSDLHVVMLFPNTQDGEWGNAVKWNLRSYNNNVGIHRGDVVQLMYYPNIANNDKTGASKVFPKGTRIGFVLKTQAWSMQGKDYSLNIGSFSGEKKYNVWCSTTDGLSYGKKLAGDNGKYPNLDGQSRGAKFSYKAANGDTYTLISFEDALDDLDFDDLIFALKPVGVFAPVPEIENKKSSTTGVYAFEDLWPNKGDYDLNDAVVNEKHEKEFNDNGKIIKETFYLTTYQNYVTKTSGLALTLNTKKNPSQISMKKIAKGSTVAEETTFRKDGNVYYLTSDIKGELGTTYILELTYSTALDSSSKMASIQPFIYRSENDDKNWEVHIPMEAPTTKMNTSYFGTADDCSDPSKGLYFVRSGNYPFAFYLKGANIEVFKETILNRDNESKRIDELFPGFLEWSISNGATHQDWYLRNL